VLQLDKIPSTCMTRAGAHVIGMREKWSWWTVASGRLYVHSVFLIDEPESKEKDRQDIDKRR